VDADVFGLTNGTSEIAYSIVTCSGVYAGDLPADLVCDQAGDIDPSTGTYGPTLDVSDPALTFDPPVVGGFFGGGADPVSVGAGSAGAGDDPGSWCRSQTTLRMTGTRS
jgi:hypothetical protein